LLFGYKFYAKTKGVKPLEADFYTGKDIIDKEEEEFLRQQAARGDNAGKFEKIYDKTLGLIF
jgi:amino acid transporter